MVLWTATVVIVSGSISTNTYRDTQWLTLGITVSSSSSGTCTTSTAMVLWTKTILNAWLFATLSLRARVTGTKPLSKKNCMGKAFADMPGAFKAFIDQYFKSIDVDGDGSVGLTEFRVDCVNRMAYKNIADLDA